MVAKTGFQINGTDFNDVYVRSEYFTEGGLWVWGYNAYSQLGDNTDIAKSSPIQTIAAGTNWKQISTGQYHTAAIKTDGTLWIWGNGALGGLGDNSQTNRSSPVQTVAGGTNWKMVSCSNYYRNGAIKTDGTLWMWGAGPVGQLGDNTTTDKSSPVQTIAAGTNWKQLACGDNHTAAIKTDGTLWTWGANAYGQLGDNTIINKSSPVQTVSGGTNWKQLSCGQHTVAIKTDGTLWSWGLNLDGMLGDNTTINRSSPVQTVAGGTNWKLVAGGGYHTAAIKTDGTLWSWGNNYQGQLGDNTNIAKSSPVQTVAGGTNWKQVSCGHIAGAAIKTDGTLWTWGNNTLGQLGDNTTIGKSSPVQTVAAGTNWKLVDCGRYHTASIRDQW